MPEDQQQIIARLEKLTLFSELDTVQLEQVAAFIHPISLRAGETLHFSGKNNPMLIVATGKLHYASLKRGKTGQSYTLNQGDFCGADVVMHGRQKAFEIIAPEPALVYSITVDGLRTLLNINPELTRSIKKQITWYNLIHSKPFSWLGDEETVKVICRKHLAYLVVVELAPLLVAWIGIAIILAATRIDTASFRLAVGWFGTAVVVMAVLWAIYRYYDWGNDYYIVTDERIVWLERTLGIYDSRQEAPLVAVKSGETKSGQLGRWFGFGDVITETFMGQVFFRHIGKPAEIKNLIDSEHKLAIERQSTSDIHTIEGKIRQKIDPTQAATVPAMATPATQQPFSVMPMQETRLIPEKLNPWQALLARFQMRRESNGIITYRKHLYILFRMTVVPAACFLGITFGTIILYSWRDQELISLFTPRTIFLVGIGLSVLAGLWWFYRFIDWSNDIYRVTPDKIIDSERKPLGTELTKSAPLENIIGLDYERLGLLGVMLNFGNVVINIGTENKFIFYGIHNPAGAQKDIFNYMYERRRKKQLSDTQQEQERVSNYIAAYHRQAEDLRQPKKPPQI